MEIQIPSFKNSVQLSIHSSKRRVRYFFIVFEQIASRTILLSKAKVMYKYINKYIYELSINVFMYLAV